jgi:hypothetical protein
MTGRRSSQASETATQGERRTDLDRDMFYTSSDECHVVETSEDDEDSDVDNSTPRMPMVFPRLKYTGACNVETVKDGESI